MPSITVCAYDVAHGSGVQRKIKEMYMSHTRLTCVGTVHFVLNLVSTYSKLISLSHKMVCRNVCYPNMDINEHFILKIAENNVKKRHVNCNTVLLNSKFKTSLVSIYFTDFAGILPATNVVHLT